MRIELVGDKNPGCLGIVGHRLRDVRDKIRFRPGIAHRRGQLLARRHFDIREQTLGAMPDILLFLTFHPTGRHRLCRSRPFQRLNAGFLIGADDTRSLRMQDRRLRIKLTDGFDVRLKFRRIAFWRVQPVLDAMRFKVGLILKNVQCWTSKSAQQSAV